jgi:hypothetical protein
MTINHKGRFLTLFSELNGMSSVSHVLHQFFNSRMKFDAFINGQEIKELNRNLFKLASEDNLKKIFELLTYSELDRGENLTTRLVQQIFKNYNKLSNVDGEKLLLAFSNSMLAISKQISHGDLDPILKNFYFYLRTLVLVLEAEKINLDTRLVDLFYRISVELKSDKKWVLKKIVQLLNEVSSSVGKLSLEEQIS